MPLYALDGIQPEFDERKSVWIAPDAQVIGNVHLGAHVGIWFGVVIRGDNERIKIGSGSNVQEHVVIHSDPGFPATIGAGCTIGHRATLHGCTIGAGSLIGMGAIILNGATIGEGSLVGAGALVTEGKMFPSNSLILGSPAKFIRTLRDEELAGLSRSADHYISNKKRFKTGLKRVDEA